METLDFNEDTTAIELQTWLAEHGLTLRTSRPGELQERDGQSCPRCGSLLGQRTVVATLQDPITGETFLGQGDLVTSVRFAIQQYRRSMQKTAPPPPETAPTESP